jgi:hypothetical protein
MNMHPFSGTRTRSSSNEDAADLCLNPLNPELNPICYLLALLAHQFLHVNEHWDSSLSP